MRLYSYCALARTIIRNQVRNGLLHDPCTTDNVFELPIAVDYRFSQKARNRWHVAYTLVKNEGLRKNRPDVEHTDSSVTYNACYKSSEYYEPPMVD